MFNFYLKVALSAILSTEVIIKNKIVIEKM